VKKRDRFNTSLEVGIWLLFFALLVPAGLDMAVADGVVYVPVANLASRWNRAQTSLGAANVGAG
jgi:hypothetical protein